MESEKIKRSVSYYAFGRQLLRQPVLLQLPFLVKTAQI
jgi:hypothetical protein